MLGRIACMLVFLAPVGCAGDTLTTPDATRFGVRDAVIDPRPDAVVDAGNTLDAGPQIDVIVFDTPTVATDAGTSPEADASQVQITCDLLAERYAINVRDSQMCTGADDCATLVCETPCCACMVYVQRATAAYLRLDDLRTRWTAMGCAAAADCPRVACDHPVSAACSSGGRCVTFRSAGDGGL